MAGQWQSGPQSRRKRHGDVFGGDETLPDGGDMCLSKLIEPNFRKVNFTARTSFRNVSTRARTHTHALTNDKCTFFLIKKEGILKKKKKNDRDHVTTVSVIPTQWKGWRTSLTSACISLFSVMKSGCRSGLSFSFKTLSTCPGHFRRGYKCTACQRCPWRHCRLSVACAVRACLPRTSDPSVEA